MSAHVLDFPQHRADHPVDRKPELGNAQPTPSAPADRLPHPAAWQQGTRWQHWLALLPLALSAAAAQAQGFDKVNTTVTNVQQILVLISVAVVTIAIMWAGYKMIFQEARLQDVANILLGGTLIGGAGAFAAFIVN